MLGGGYVNYFSIDNRSYQVIPQVAAAVAPEHRPDHELPDRHRERRPDPALGDRDREPRGDAAVDRAFPAAELGHDLRVFPRPGVASSDALNALKSIAARTLPQGYSVDYGGQSRQFVQESSGMAGRPSRSP